MKDRRPDVLLEIQMTIRTGPKVSAAGPKSEGAANHQSRVEELGVPVISKAYEEA